MRNPLKTTIEPTSIASRATISIAIEFNDPPKRLINKPNTTIMIPV